jgi:hypothetical protein
MYRPTLLKPKLSDPPKDHEFIQIIIIIIIAVSITILTSNVCFWVRLPFIYLNTDSREAMKLKYTNFLYFVTESS